MTIPCLDTRGYFHYAGIAQNLLISLLILKASWPTYSSKRFPGILKSFMECIEAIRFIHQHGDKHGDIRRDYIPIDRPTRSTAGSISTLINGTGKIFTVTISLASVTFWYFWPVREICWFRNWRKKPPSLAGTQARGCHIVFNNRVANLKKIYHYILKTLNRVLMHFLKNTYWFYEHSAQLLDDLGEFKP